MVIGGGAVGTITAMLAAEQGRSVLLLRLSDLDCPQAETLRNQAWLQSGALFTRLKGEPVPSALSRRLRAQSRRLITTFNLPDSTSRGIARFDRDQTDEIDLFLDDAHALGLGTVVREIPDHQARHRLGLLHRPETVCIEVPDAPFDEAAMLAFARARARSAGAISHVCSTPVELRPVDDGAGCEVAIDGRWLRARRVVLAAGIGNLALMDPLQVSHGLVVQRTPLLVIPSAHDVVAPILVDLSQKLAVARHGPAQRGPSGCLVAGVKVGTELDPAALLPRSTPGHEWSAIYAQLPPSLQDDRSGHRVTCGYEVMRSGPNRVRKEDLIVEPLADHPGVVMALPGRATLSLRAAEKVLESLDWAEAPDEAIDPTPTKWETNRPWNSGIHMHHQPVYDHLDERSPNDNQATV